MAEPFPIKVCGITRQVDADLAVRLGAMALGFIFYPKSPRFITPIEAGRIIKNLGESSVLKVAVTVNADRQDILNLVKVTGVDVIQLHGDETPEYCASLAAAHIRLWKAFRIRDEDQLKGVSVYAPYVEAFLFDAAVEGAYGGTGHALSRDLLEKIPQGKPALLAGGLGPDNWLSIYETYKPWAIDLSSSVEVSPGIKDPEKLRKLFFKRNPS